jgi:hypothetical protein
MRFSRFHTFAPAGLEYRGQFAPLSIVPLRSFVDAVQCRLATLSALR